MICISYLATSIPATSLLAHTSQTSSKWKRLKLTKHSQNSTLSENKAEAEEHENTEGIQASGYKHLDVAANSQLYARTRRPVRLEQKHTPSKVPNNRFLDAGFSITASSSNRSSDVANPLFPPRDSDTCAEVSLWERDS